MLNGKQDTHALEPRAWLEEAMDANDCQPLLVQRELWPPC